MNNTFELFGLTIHWYGVILTTGMICALFLLIFLFKKKKVETDFALTVFLFAIVFAIAGARAFYVVPRAEYWQSWEGVGRAFNISEGGLTIVGGVIVGATGIVIACLLYKKSPARILDMVVPAVLLGQVIGRWGNYVNQELYGVLVTQDWLKFFPMAVLIGGQWHYASFFYEMCLNAAALAAALTVSLKLGDKLKPGFLTVCYIIWYGVVRAILEIIKEDPLMWGNIKAMQLMCSIGAVIGVVVLLLLQTNKIKFETEAMYRKHFNVTYDPPPYSDSKPTSEQ